MAYECWHCKADCVFTAQDQKHSFEVQNAKINQHRRLCTAMLRGLEPHSQRAA
ncbi:zinc-ribbon domain containing protein [Roseateles sp. DC23W]|uniref:Zinc-ribbon domain containing protein n=1 Tax=Pelomonas dachongensis TaxID=3299029 RepID=A0ABW7EGP8_9BURK